MAKADVRLTITTEEFDLIRMALEEMMEEREDRFNDPVVKEEDKTQPRLEFIQAEQMLRQFRG